MKRTMKRTIKRVIDLQNMQYITIESLLNFNDHEYNNIRRIATSSHIDEKERYVCEECGYGVYAPVDKNKKPYWKHFKNSSPNCPWWTGNTKDINEISAIQFQGKQESRLHSYLKHKIGDILKSDINAKDVRIEERITGDTGYRIPDIYCVYKNRKIVFEVQLAHTQIPIIMAREKFYTEQNIGLI